MAVSFRENLRQGMADLVAHPSRTALTVLGFGISMAIAVLLVSAGNGLGNTVSQVLSSIGQGQMVLDPGRTTGLAGSRRAGRKIKIRYKDLDGIQERLPSFDGLAPYMKLWGGGASSWKYSIPFSPGWAVGADYMKVRGFPLTEGRWFSSSEAETGDWVAVLNLGLREMLFPGHEAIGRWIEWRGRRLNVVGVVRDESSFPYVFYVPYEIAHQMRDSRYVSEIVARPRAGVPWDEAVSEARRVFGAIAGFDPADTNALDVEDNREFTGKVETVTSAMHALVLTIAAVSLALGGLGVANMMVISVTERTREIGIRKALGAEPRTIYWQVLLEACTVLTLGGVLGVILAAIACRAIGTLPLTETYAVHLTLNWWVVLTCLAALAAVCLLAGTIPARRAAALPPVEALRWA